MTQMLPVGIYEKALPPSEHWEERLLYARQAGFDFVELSCDETAGRQARLRWTSGQRSQLRQAMVASGVPLLTMCLSAHRRLSLGSADPSTRQAGLDLMHRAIDFCADIGIRTIQVAGYYDYYNDIDAGTRQRYIDGIAACTQWASQAHVMLAVETMEGSDVVHSVASAMQLVGHIDSPWFQIYPDIGNIASHGHDVHQDLIAGRGHIVAVHIKDARPGEPRRVPFGEGVVPFIEAFDALARIGFSGPMVIEMWNDDSPDSLQRIRQARHWVTSAMKQAGLWRVIEQEQAAG